MRSLGISRIHRRIAATIAWPARTGDARGRRCPIPASYGSGGVALWRGEGERDDPRGRGWRGGGARRRAALSGGGQQGSPVRRRVLHRGDLDRYLLPAVLPGDHAETPEQAVLPERGRGPGGGLPGPP